MATLETYKNGPDVLLTTVAEDTGKCLAPGRWVSQGSGDDILGLGIVVGVTDDEVAVLWSVPPYGSSQEDIAYFQKKLFAALKIPREMLQGVADQAHQAKVALDCFNRSLRNAR